MKCKSVVVGGAGFIGSHVVDALIARGGQVCVIDNLVAGKRERIPAAAEFHQIDICEDDLAQAFSGASTVFHLAALPSVQYSIEDPIAANEVNTTGTLRVLEAARKAGVTRVIYSGSSAAYGDHPELPLHEELREKPVTPYGLQKYMGEEYMRLYASLFGIETATLRYFNVYGPRMNPDGPYAGAIGRFLKQCAGGEPLTIVGDGEQTRDFVHVTDVARANLLASESEQVGHGEVINIGSGIRLTVNTLAALIGGEVTHVPPRNEPRDSQADIRKAKALLGWEPSVKLEDAIADLRHEQSL